MITLRHTLGHVGLLGVLLVGCPAWAGPPWEQVTEADGMLVERRPLPGTGRYEVRVSTYAPFPPRSSSRRSGDTKSTRPLCPI